MITVNEKLCTIDNLIYYYSSLNLSLQWPSWGQRKVAVVIIPNLFFFLVDAINIVIMLTVVCEYIAPSKVTCQNKTETKQKQKPATHGQNQFCDLLLIHVHINMGVFIHRLSVFDFLSVLSVEG